MGNENMLDLLNERNQMLINQRKVYLATVSNVNMRYGELLKDDFGSKLMQNCARDAAGEVVRKFFDTSDYYITIDQMYDRIVHFSYEGGSDPLAEHSDAIRKNMYNMNDNPKVSRTLKNISSQCQESQTKLFHKEEFIDGNGKTKKRYIDSKIMENGKKAYRQLQKDTDGMLYDELSGNRSDVERLEVDHSQAAATARYNSMYLNTPEAIQALKEFYNSPENFQMLEKRANGSKGDVRVYADGDRKLSDNEVKAIRKDIKDNLKNAYISKGMDTKEAEKKAAAVADEEITKKYDITYKAGAREVANAVCQRWENTSGETREELIRTGKLTKDGKVPKNVQEKLEKDLRESMNAESKVVLKHMDYCKVKDTALEETKQGLAKIIAGQVIYYVLPPVVFESQQIIKKKNMTIERFFEEFKASGKRIIKYVKSKLGTILKNLMGNSANKFLKAFFDIIIETVKETVKRLVKIAKQLVLSLLQCVKIIGSKNSTQAEKADAVTRTLSVTATSVVLEILFEYMEKQFGLPDIVMEPLQFIVTIIATNLVMLILEKADLFDVRYGLLVENIDNVFKEEQLAYENTSIELLEQAKLNIESGFEKVKNHIVEIRTQVSAMNFYKDDVVLKLNEINKIYNMGIDFDKEWIEFCASM